MTIKDELLKLQESAPGGLLKPPDVVDWARKHPRSAIHHALEWDDYKAAEAHRAWQVRHLISVHMVETDGTPMMVSLTPDRVDGGYRSMTEVLAAPNLRDTLLADALADLDRAKAKYSMLTALAKVWMEVGKVQAKTAPKGKPAAPPSRRKPARGEDRPSA